MAKLRKLDIMLLTPAFILLSMILWHYLPTPLCISLVMGKSMYPTIESASMVIGVSTALIKPEINDIVIVKLDGHYVIHRLVLIRGDTTITKGDANPVPDPPTSISDIRYVVVAIIPPQISSFLLPLMYFYILFSLTYLAYRIYYLNTRRVL